MEGGGIIDEGKMSICLRNSFYRSAFVLCFFFFFLMMLSIVLFIVINEN